MMTRSSLLLSVPPLLLICLPAVWVLAAAAAADVVPPAHRCQSRCGDVDIPYPFGIGDQCAIHSGFNLNCTRLADGTYRPFNGPFEVTHISVPDAKAWMKMNISWRCYEVNQTKASPWWYQFTDTPFRFSYEDNRIYVIGCNTLAYMMSEPMVSSIRHSRNGHAQRSTSRATNSSDAASQRTSAGRCSSRSSRRINAATGQPSSVQPQSGQPPKQRGRKLACETKLVMPRRGHRVLLEPLGDSQFTYVNYHEAEYKYTSQIGVILKREYPGLVEDKDQHGVVIKTRPAMDWSDYFLTVKDDDGLTAGDRVISEFWRLFDVKSEDDEEAYRVFDNYVRKKVRDMMYQARVDAVKMYYDKKLNQKLDDKLARPIELKYEEYLGGKLKWCSKTVWPYLCRYWCSEEFLIKRKRGQESRLGSDDVAQNHGGSRPFGETRQVLEEKFGPQYATIINTFSAMKSGIKKLDESGRTGTISRKAQSIVDEYTKKCKAAHPNESEQQELDGKVLYDISGGMRHGRLAIANGAVRKVDVMSAAKEKSAVPTNSVSYGRLAKDNQHLRRANRCLQERLDLMGDITNDLILDLYRDMKKEVPASVKGHLAALRAPLPTSSSHVGEDMDGEDTDADYMEGEDTDDEDDLDVDGDDDEELDGDDDNANVGSNNGGMNDGSNSVENMVI